MKTKRYIKISFGLAFIICLGLISFNAIAQSKNNSVQEIVDDINITIDKSTSESDFEDIKKTLKNYNISVEFTDIRRNDLEEITEIGIKLYNDKGQQAMSKMSSNMPISEISFGSKNGSLYVGQGDQQLNMFALFNGNNRFPSAFDNDSIFGKHFQHFDLSEFFNDNDAFFMFDGDSMSIDKLRDKMMQRFSFKNPQGDRFSFMFDNDDTTTNKSYSFIDDPDKEKVIVIDGEFSDFKTLDRLAKANKISDVDILKPETAMSIYGEKAKDGALIVTTK